MCKKLTWFMVLAMAVSMAAGVAFGQSVNINFQQEGGDLVEGYLPDYGEVYGDRGNGFSYGWNEDIMGDARDRDQERAPDQRYDTLLHFSKGTDHTWEIELEDGEYDLFIVCGDSNHTDQTNTLDVEGVVVVDEDGEMEGDYWDEYTVPAVDVVDGRLTIVPTGDAGNAKICFIDIVQVGPPRQAMNPSPAVGASDLLRDEVVLSWAAGPYGDLHNVYVGANADDVAMADIDANNVPEGVMVATVDVTSYAPGRLALGTTYYWRVDEVSLDPNIPVASSAIWSFTVEPGLIKIEDVVASASTAYSDVFSAERTVDGSGLDGDGHSADGRDMWLSNGVSEAPVLTYEFDTARKLDHMLVWNSNTGIESIVGYGAKDVTIEYSDGGTWMVLGDVEFAQAAGVEGAGPEMIDLGGIGADAVRLTINSNHSGGARYGLAEVCFFYIPVKAREPQPVPGTTDVAPDATLTLSWRSGLLADVSELQLSSDMGAVANNKALADAVVGNSVDIGPLDVGTTYYWKINEVNTAETPAFIDGDIWSFSTQPFFTVDDFEAYSGDLGDTWKDGWAKNTGSGDTGTHTIDTTVVEGGAQSMLLSYDNSKSPYVVEVERSISSRKNWTNNGVTRLVLSFLGDPGNSPRDRLYVKINGKQIYYGGDITSPWWKAWSIKLSGLGINITDIVEIAVGVGDTPLPAGGKGKIYIDNIRLYKAAPSAADIVDVVLGLNGDGQFDTLIAALLAADPALLEELSSEGAYTVFAPTDDAFDALGINADNVGSVDEAVLNDVLLYHVAAGTMLAADLPADIAVLEGSPLMQADGVLTDDTGGQATVTQADAVASNGVVHVIDAVLLPYNLATVADLLAQANAEGDLAGQFDTVLAALDVADASVAAALAADDQVTLFAPTDDALAALGLDPNSVADPNVVDPALVTEILLTHVGVGRLLAADLPAEIETLEGSTLAQAGGVLTDDTGAQATVTAADIEAINGVIHAIDAVVLPYNLVSLLDLITMLNSEGDLAGQLDVLIAGVNADAAVLETLSGMDQHTVFAPTDDAFAALDITVETLAELDPNMVADILLYHAAGGRLLAGDVLASAEIAMLGGGSVMQADGILTDSIGGTAALIATDGEALNGVVHVIDAVLQPYDLFPKPPEPPVDPNTVPRPW